MLTAAAKSIPIYQQEKLTNRLSLLIIEPLKLFHFPYLSLRKEAIPLIHQSTSIRNVYYGNL